MSTDRYLLGLIGALQAAQDRDIRQQQLDRQNQLLQVQLANSDVEREWRKAATDKLRSEVGDAGSLADFAAAMTGATPGTPPPASSTGAPPPSTPTPSATPVPSMGAPQAPAQPGVKPTSMNMEDVNRAVAVLPPELRNVAIQEIARTGMSPALVAAIPRLVKQESGGQQFGPGGSVLTSPKGARGIFQIMPATAGDLGINPDDPAQNVQGGIRYLAQMGDRFKDPQLALAAYNAGPGAVQKAGGIPNIRETQDYVQKVGGLPIGSYEVAAGGSQASDAYPAVPAASKTAGTTASGGASPTEQMSTVNEWERYWIGRAMAQPGLSKSGRVQAVDLVRKEAERRRSELKFQNTEAHYRERMDNQERNFRVREEARGVTDEMRRAHADMKEQAAALKAEQSAAKDKSSRLARLDAIAGNVSKITRPETDITTGETKYNTIEDPDMKRRIASSLRNLQAYLSLDELTWQDVANDLADEYKAHLVFYKEQGVSPEDAARKAMNDAHAIVHEKWRDKSGDATAKDAEGAKKSADVANSSPGKLESEKDASSSIDPDTGLPEAPVTNSTYLKPTSSQATGLPVNAASKGDFISSPAAPPAPAAVSSNIKPADVPKYMEDEKRYREQRKDDLRFLRNVGIPTDSRSFGQVADMAGRALGLPLFKEAGRMISDAYERNYGETGHQKDVGMAIQAYESASPDVRAAMDVQARRKWGVTISELIREHKKSRDKGAD